VRAASTTIEFLEGADTLESLVLMPVCAERPYPTVDPNSTGGDKPKNTSIIINFGKVIQNPVEDLENIDIQIQEENKSIKSHYLKPTFIDERRGIQFIADDNNLIPLDSGTKVVDVIIPGVFYSTEPDGTKVQMAKEVTSSFTINYTTKSSATVSLEVDSTTGSLNRMGNIQFYMGEQFNVIYKMNNGYQFDRWEISSDGGETVEVREGKIYLNGTAVLEELSAADGLEEYYASQNQYQKSYKVLSAARYLKIKPVSYERPKVKSVLPKNTEAVAKNSPVVITFSKKMDIPEADLKNISIKLGNGLDAKEYFENPLQETVTDDEGERTQITIKADRNNLIDASQENKNFTVTIPQNFGYTENGVKVTLLSDYAYTYTVNDTTEDKINLSFVAVTGGTLASGSKTLYLDNTYTVSCNPSSEEYEVKGWKVYVRNTENEKDESNPVSEEILGQTVSEDKKSITFKAKNGFTGTVMVKPVCELRKTVSVSPSVNSTLGSLKITGKNKLYMGETITLMFTMAEGYQFGGWNVSLDESTPGNLETKNGKVYLNGKAVLEEVSNGEDFDEEYYASRNKYQKIYKAVDSATGIKITPVCYERPVVTSVTPSNTAAVAKNSSIIISFSKGMNITEADLDNISITMDGLSIKEYFAAPVTDSSSGSTNITFAAKRDKLLEITGGTKNIIVKIPQSLGYKVNGVNVNLLSDYSYTYSVNNTTEDKINLSFVAVTGGTLASGSKTLYLDNTYTVSCEPSSDAYEVNGWKVYVRNSENEADESSSVSADILGQTVSENKKSITFEAKSGFTGTVMVKPVCELRKTVSVSPAVNASLGSMKITGKTSLYMDETITLMFTMAEGYQFGGWNVSLDESATGTIETKNGKVYLNGKAVLEEVSNGEDFDEDYYASRNKYQKIYKAVDSATGLKISPVCYERPVVSSVTPSNASAVAKNSPIEISFSKKMDIKDSDLENISITMDGLSVKDYFGTPVADSSSGITKIKIAANSEKLLDVTGGIKNITVSIPETFGYTENGVKVSLLSGYSYTYRINNNTTEKVELNISSAANSTLDGAGTKTLYLNESYTIECVPSEGYEVTGWDVLADGTSVFASILERTFSSDKRTVTLTALRNIDSVVTVKPVISERKAVFVIPEVETAYGKLNLKSESKKLYMDETITLMFTMAEGYQFGGWNVSLEEGVSGTIETKNGKVYLNGKEVLEEVSNGEDFDEEYYASRNKYQKIYKAVDSASGLKISPVCYEKPVVGSVTPSNTAAVAKNSPIEISFSKKMDIKDSDLENISITMDGISIKEFFDSPVAAISNGVTKITIAAKNGKLLEVTGGTKNITVSIPKTLAYIENGVKVSLLSDYSYTYKINSTTTEKVELNISSALNSTLDGAGTKTLYLNESYTINCTPSEGYEVTGWDVIAGGSSVFDTILKRTFSSDKRTITLTALKNIESAVTVKPVVAAKKYVQIIVASDYGTTIPAGNAGKYYSGESIDLDYREDSEYQFTNWKITKKSGSTFVELTDEDKEIFKFNTTVNEDGEIQNGAESINAALNLGTLKEDCIIRVSAVSAKRPKIVSTVPTYDPNGVYRDRSIIILFDTEMDPLSIYWTEEELTAIGIVPQNEYKIEKKGKTYYYGYKKDGNIFYRNLSINKRLGGTNILECFGAPEFDELDSSVLRIKTNDSIPPSGATDILVTVGKDICYKSNEFGKNVILGSNYSWSYYTNGSIDKYAPAFNEDFQIYSDKELEKAVETVKEEIVGSGKVYKTTIPANNLKAKKVWVKGYITDGGSGPASIKWELNRLHDDIYPQEVENKNIMKGQFDLLVEANSAKIIDPNTKDEGIFVDLKEALEAAGEGLYKFSVYASDKNGNESVKNSFFIYDETAPVPLKKEYISNVRNSADEETISWIMDPAGSDVDHIEIDRYYNDSHKESFVQPDDSTLTKTFTSLTNQRKYEYRFYSVDYAGNKSEIYTSYKDETGPSSLVAKSDISNSRTSAGSETVSWSANPTGSDVDHIEIDRFYDDSDKETFIQDDGSTLTKIFTGLTNLRKYEYRFYSVDYSGNRSEDYTLYTDETGPSSLVAKANITNSRTSAGNETVSWSANPTGDDVDHIEIDRFYDDSDKETFIQDDDSILTNIFTGLTNQRKYEYRFYSVDYSGNRSADYTLYTDETGPSSLVTKLNISNSRTSAGSETVSWSENPTGSDVDHVIVERYYNGTKKDSFTQTSSSTKSKTFTDLTNQQKYEYRFYSVDYSGNRSADYTLYTDETGPSSLVTQSNISNSRTSAAAETISWSANPTGSDVDHVIVERYYKGTKKDSFTQSTSSTKSKTFTGLTNQQKYEYRFYSVDYSGNVSTSYTAYQDNTAPGKVTANQSEGRDHRIILKFTPPDDVDFSNVTVSYGDVNGTQYDMADPKRNTQFTWTIKDDSNPLTNGNTYSYYLRAKDYSGNVSDYICMSETVGAMPGMICYAPGNSYGNIFCSKNYWPGKNPLGLVAGDRDNNQQYVLVLALDQTNQYIYGPNSGDFCADNVFSENIGGLPVVGFTATYNNTTGWHWYNLVTTNDNYKKVATSNSIWAYARDVKNKNSCITWYIPTRVEWQFVAWNWKRMCTARETLSAGGVSSAGIAANTVYYVATPNYYNNRCNFVGVNYNDNGNMNEHLAEGEWMNLYTTSWKQDKYNRTQNYGAYTRCICDVDMR